MEWLAQNLDLAYPFIDDTSDSVIRVFVDALVSCGTQGPYTLTTFAPEDLTNAHVKITHGATTLFEAFTATPTTLGDYTVLVGSDATRGTSYKFILVTSLLPTFPGLSAPVEFAPAACAFNDATLTSLNGLTGDVVLSIPDHSQLVIDGQQVAFGFQDPVDRVDCDTADCDKVFTINGQAPDQFGSFVVSPDGCYRLVPHPADHEKLLLFNFCQPCLDCDNVVELDTKFATQSDYYHHLAAIYHDHFNRYQRGVAKANREIVEAQTRGVVVTNGIVDISGRSFTRPYFSQLSLALLNSTTYQITIELIVTVTPSGVSDQLTYVPDTSLLQRFQVSGNQFTPLAALPGSVTVTLAPQESVAISTEVKRTSVNPAAPAMGSWHVIGNVTFVAGTAPLPDSGILVRDYALELKTDS